MYLDIMFFPHLHKFLYSKNILLQYFELYNSEVFFQIRN